ncbi:hypothetical protein ACFL5G_04065 [Candidatus Margulisiibacteriota bacterium]
MEKMILVLICLAIAGTGFAHPPRDVDIKVDGNKVEVTVDHPVGNTKLHLIDKIDLYVNGKKMVKQTFLVQGENGQKVIYIIPSLKAEDVIKVKASCNKYGDKSKRLEVKGKQAKDKKK